MQRPTSHRDNMDYSTNNPNQVIDASPNFLPHPFIYGTVNLLVASSRPNVHDWNSRSEAPWVRLLLGFKLSRRFNLYRHQHQHRQTDAWVSPTGRMYGETKQQGDTMTAVVNLQDQERECVHCEKNRGRKGKHVNILYIDHCWVKDADLFQG